MSALAFRYAAHDSLLLKNILRVSQATRKSSNLLSISSFASQPSCPSFVVTARRGAKTVTRRRVKELQQGSIPAEPLPALVPDDEPQLPVVLQGVKNNMARFENCVVLTRVGNFYEVDHCYFKAPRDRLTHCSCTSSMLKSMVLCSISKLGTSVLARKTMRSLSRWQDFHFGSWIVFSRCWFRT